MRFKRYILEIEPAEFEIDSQEHYETFMTVLGHGALWLAENTPEDELALLVWEIP